MQSIYQSTGCSGTCDVSGPGSPAYDNAWFEINYVRAYTTGGPTPTSTPTSSSTAGSAASTTIATVITTAAGSDRTGGGANQSNSSMGPPRWHAGSAGAMGLVYAVLGMLLLA